MEWYQIKQFVAHATSISMDALHVVVGIIGLLIAARVLRLSIADGRPWLILLVIEVLNELNDLHVEEWPERATQYGEGAKDVVLTMLIPTLLLVVARSRPRLLAGRPASIDDEMPRRPEIILPASDPPRGHHQAETHGED
ncbi:hypothetical protein [Sphingomonas sp. LY160]|uniref:hypothetical protein n=1 Tax=Sphingomonas sp. LY160 TaxID=3095342 RepID=UPI002ADEE2AA|nr:hypothetical protein [Sphingomonas sp. LY160]MEA1071019.1 hypothetical protein [Sphingomonas sp. LY160]